MLSPEAEGRLDELSAWIARAGVAAGLTGYDTADAVRTQGMAPAIAIADRLGCSAFRVAEIGPGSGALGLALAILRPDSRVVLVDSSARSAALVDMTARRLRIANAVAHRVRLPMNEPEEIGGPFDVVIVRAFAPAAVAVPMAAGLCRKGGRVMWLHSADDAAGGGAIGTATPTWSAPSGVAGMLITEWVVCGASADAQI